MRVSERDMADAFEILLRKHAGFAGLPEFSSTFREVACRQGIADFVAASGPCLEAAEFQQMVDGARSAGTGWLAALSLLRRAAPRSISYLVRQSGLARRTVCRALARLARAGLVLRTPSGSYLLAPAWCPPPVEIWAFELKVNDWRRALFQALQCRAFANYVVAVFPSQRRKLAQRHIDKFKRLNVGVMLLDVEAMEAEILSRPSKNGPSSRLHYLHAFTQLVSSGGSLRS